MAQEFSPTNRREDWHSKAKACDLRAREKASAASEKGRSLRGLHGGHFDKLRGEERFEAMRAAALLARVNSGAHAPPRFRGLPSMTAGGCPTSHCAGTACGVAPRRQEPKPAQLPETRSAKRRTSEVTQASLLSAGVEPNPGPGGGIEQSFSKRDPITGKVSYCPYEGQRIQAEIFKPRGSHNAIFICPTCSMPLTDVDGSRRGLHPTCPKDYGADSPPPSPRPIESGAGGSLPQAPATLTAPAAAMCAQPCSSRARPALTIIRPSSAPAASCRAKNNHASPPPDPPKVEVRAGPTLKNIATPEEPAHLLDGVELNDDEVVAVMQRVVGGPGLSLTRAMVDSIDFVRDDIVTHDYNQQYRGEMRPVICRGVKEVRAPIRLVSLTVHVSSSIDLLLPFVFGLLVFILWAFVDFRAPAIPGWVLPDTMMQCLLPGSPRGSLAPYDQRQDATNWLMWFCIALLVCFMVSVTVFFLPLAMSKLRAWWRGENPGCDLTWRLTYCPHIVTCVLSEFQRGTNAAAARSSIRQKMARLACLPLADRDFVAVLNGSELVIEVLLERQSFFMVGAAQ